MTAPHLQGLNPPQREAVEYADGPLLVLAGAGSGKTRVLTRRIAHLVFKGVHPGEILAVTFTNKAAAEMKHRVVDLVGPRGDHILVSTFHSACARFLRRDADKLGISRSFTIWDDDDQRRVMKVLLQEAGIDPKRHPPRKILREIDQAKNRLQRPEDLPTHGAGDPLPTLYARYERALREADAVDFNDLVNLVVRLWQEHPDVLARYQDRYRHLLVDEYQDTNRAQYMLVQLLAARDRRVTVVGDDDQSIYGFRGADLQNILDFERDFPDARVVRLEQNYRSTGNILKAANAVVGHNQGRMRKTLWTDKGDGAPVGVVVASDPEDEADRVVKLARGYAREGRAWGEMAIIYRTNASSRAFEKALASARIPHVLVGARKFYERREIRDMVAYLRLLLNPADDMAFVRAINSPPRGIGAKALDGIRQEAASRGVPLLEGARSWSEGKGRGRAGAGRFVRLIADVREAARTQSPGQVVERLAAESGYLERLRNDGSLESKGRIENLQELARAVEEDEDLPLDPTERLQAFIDRASLAGQSDELPDPEGKGQITLLTSHLAKGLEFPIVFVGNVTEGGFPHFLAMEREADIEEERRLIYVVITRAMERLVLCRPRRRMVQTEQGYRFQAAEPSRFLREIPSELMEVHGGAPVHSAAASAARAQRLGFSSHARPAAPRPRGAHRTIVPESASDFAPGVRVLHPKFGAGSVVRQAGSPSNPKVTVRFDVVGLKTMMLRVVPLELLDE